MTLLIIPSNLLSFFRSKWVIYRRKKKKMHWMKSEYLHHFKMIQLLLIRRHFLRIHRRLSASSWSSQMMETSTRRFLSSKNRINSLMKRRYGVRSLKWQKRSKYCMRRKYFIEIWSLPTFSWIEMEPLNLVISMSQKLPKRDYCTHKQERHTTHLQRFGKTSLMTKSLISGLSDALFMKWQRSNHHLEPKTWTAYIKKCLRERTLKFPRNTQKI